MGKAGKVLITGIRGQLGRDLEEILSDLYETTGVDLPELDICDQKSVLRLIMERRPDIVIHAAAYTDVDGAETNRDTATAINVGGTENVALACRQVGARMVYISTDYVFNGEKEDPYTENDPINPRTVYGLTKLQGEDRVKDIIENFVIIRIAWLYGRHGNNFVKTMIRLGREQLRKKAAGEGAAPLKVVDDQVGNPTWTVEVCRQIITILQRKLSGVIHATSEDVTSWYGFARAVFQELGMEVEVIPCTTVEFPRPAPRPAMSALENRRLKYIDQNIMRPWREALADFLQTYGGELTP
jgi:dTDP-4-dehydrorhamnose reductase